MTHELVRMGHGDDIRLRGCREWREMREMRRVLERGQKL